MVLSLYIALTIIGGGLVLLAALGGVFGGHDAEVSGGGPDVDAHVDAPTLDADHGAVEVDHSVMDAHSHGLDMQSLMGKAAEIPKDPGIWLPFFSVRFWIYFAAAFGSTGLALNLFRASQEPVTLIASLLTGLFVGVGGSLAWRLLNTSQIDASTKSKDFIGSVGRLSVGTRPGSLGRVRLYVRDEWIDLTAVSDSGEEIAQGEEVIVVSIEGVTARVIPSQEIMKELLNRQES